MGCDGIIGFIVVVDRCGVCNGDGSLCVFGFRDSVVRNIISIKKVVILGVVNFIISVLDWLKWMGYDVDRCG